MHFSLRYKTHLKSYFVVHTLFQAPLISPVQSGILISMMNCFQEFLLTGKYFEKYITEVKNIPQQFSYAGCAVEHVLCTTLLKEKTSITRVCEISSKYDHSKSNTENGSSALCSLFNQ